ncbi:MAG: phosphoglycolate phosphatase [Rhodospirillales bacterium]|nr:phosphoglycolate phosphatase [Rhodospirillales bacterium]
MPRSRFPKPAAIVFDLDGTLVDSAPDLSAALNRLLVEHRRATVPLAAVRQMVGDGAAKLVERGFSATGGMPAETAPLVRRFLEIYTAGIADLSRPFPGVTAALDRFAAAGIALGVCTNKPTPASRALLDALDLTRFFAAILGGDGPVRKPDPRHLTAVLDQLGAAPAAALMVGDSMNDVAVARAAKVPVVAVSFGYTKVPAAELGADALIDDFAELPGLIGL